MLLQKRQCLQRAPAMTTTANNGLQLSRVQDDVTCEFLTVFPLKIRIYLANLCCRNSGYLEEWRGNPLWDVVCIFSRFWPHELWRMSLECGWQL